MLNKRKMAFILAVFLVIHSAGIALAYGIGLSFPAAKLYAVTQGYSSNHRAIDYGFPSHTPVAAAKAGTVVESNWIYADNDHWTVPYNDNRDRGNYIILDHGSGNQTWYHHMSNQGITVTNGTNVSRGQHMAWSDNTGYTICSPTPCDASHLHFAVIVGGAAVDPYASGTQWVSGSPIPVGYVDGSGTHGPYRIFGAVEAKWVSIEGGAGSPVNEEHCPANSPGVPNSDDGVVQDFTSNNSRILWSGATSVHWVYGGISAKYIDVGGPWPNPAPGYPTSDEYQWGTYRRTDFDRGYITWRSDQGTVWNYTTYTSRGTCHW